MPKLKIYYRSTAFAAERNPLEASHADVLRGSSRVPAPRSGMEAEYFVFDSIQYSNCQYSIFRHQYSIFRLSYLSYFHYLNNYDLPHYSLFFCKSHVRYCRLPRHNVCHVLTAFLCNEYYYLLVNVGRKRLDLVTNIGPIPVGDSKFQMRKKEREICEFEINLKNFYACALI